MSAVMNQEFYELVLRAQRAGMAAAEALVPRAMVVREVNPISGQYEGGAQYHVPEGVCGFAWVVVRPGNSPFARYLKAINIARKGYGGGVHVWVSGYNQSMERKEAYAEAYAKVLQEAGIKAYADSRMD